jgi:RNA polymerase sigma-70 factor (ECF subfamily)
MTRETPPDGPAPTLPEAQVPGTSRSPAAEPPVSMERALVSRALKGDDRAFRMIYERHAPAVFRFLRDQLGNESSADEATQETFVRAHRKLATIREQDKLAPWLFGIARNVFLEQLRARRGAPVPETDEILERAEAPAPSPEALLLGREADEVFAAALTRLPEERKAALLLLMDHGLSYDEIADVMGWSLPKVKVEIHRARLKLRAELTKYLGGKS